MSSPDLEMLDPSDPGPVDPTRIERSADGRPRIRIDCPNENLHANEEDVEYDGRPGRIAGARSGTTKQCPQCKGRGYRTALYTRCTSFVSVLDDRSALEKWQKRVLLRGLALEAQPLIDDLLGLELLNPDDPKLLDQRLNKLAEQAHEAGDGYEKARKGTDLHALSELVDAGQPLPAELYNADAEAFRPVTLQDRADMAAYVRVRDELGLVYLDRELFVVEDQHKIGGTFDGLAHIRNPPPPEIECPCQKPVIVDLKTGRTDYGQGKMAQQLAVYAHSSRYDPATGERTPLDACPHVGIIIALPQGTGEATWFALDLERAWSAVALSAAVREERRQVARGVYVIGGTVPGTELDDQAEAS